MCRDILLCKNELVALRLVRGEEWRRAETGDAGMMSKLGERDERENPSRNQRDAGDMGVVKRTWTDTYDITAKNTNLAGHSLHVAKEG